MLEDNIKLREKSEARFQAFFDKELNRLKNDFRNETEVCIYLILYACVYNPVWVCLGDLYSYLDLANTFVIVRQIREREDDEIIEALNRYTLKLQTSLKVVNSTDMWAS